jgi:hypothetical protein
MTKHAPITIEKTVLDNGNEVYDMKNAMNYITSKSHYLKKGSFSLLIETTNFKGQLFKFESDGLRSTVMFYDVVRYVTVPFDDHEAVVLKMNDEFYTTRENMDKFLQMVKEINKEIEETE